MNSSLIDIIQEKFANESKEIIESFDWNLIDEFTEFLKNKNEEGGFFSKKDGDLVMERHLVESIYLVFILYKRVMKDMLRKKANEKKNSDSKTSNASSYPTVSHETMSPLSIVDVGTGPGLPGFLFACLKENLNLTLLDGQRRKLGLTEKWWLEILKKDRGNSEKESYDSLSWKDKKIQFVYARVEECEGEFDMVTMRATVPYPFSIEVICRIVKKNGYFFPFLGKELDWKHKEKEILSDSGFILEDEYRIDELSFLGERKIKVLKKKASPKHGIPRDWKTISRDIKGAEWVK